MARAALALLPVLLLAGCFSEILTPVPDSVLAFTCAVLDPAVADRVEVEPWSAAGVELDAGRALEALRGELQAITGRPSASVVVFPEREGPTVPSGGWTPERVTSWGQQHVFLEDRSVTLSVFLVPSLGENATGASGPGVVALAEDAVEAIADRLDVSPLDVARVVLLHHAGHALGAVNRGIPVQDPTIQVWEGPPGHEPDPASVMNVGWEDADEAAWAPGAGYFAYSDGLRRDWAAATGPQGVCNA
ncbi:MAG TPA: hypothetical protein VI796_06675 [Candidatus Thermoplasmatota archaeon]|nr:hypothetical protein [Candidatus Thermoplasmatota archaeon]